jgi:hypothetical protein
LKAKILKGFLLGIFANAIGTFLYIYFFSDHDVEYVIEKGVEQGFLGGLIGLGALLNLLLFFFFLTKRIGKFQKPIQIYEWVFAECISIQTFTSGLGELLFLSNKTI